MSLVNCGEVLLGRAGRPLISMAAVELLLLRIAGFPTELGQSAGRLQTTSNAGGSAPKGLDPTCAITRLRMKRFPPNDGVPESAAQKISGQRTVPVFTSLMISKILQAFLARNRARREALASSTEIGLGGQLIVR